MVYNFLCKDEKTRRNIYLLLLKTSVWKEVRHFFRTVHPNRNHVTTHPVYRSYKYADQHVCIHTSSFEFIEFFSCSTQLSTKFQLLIKTKIPTNEVFLALSLICCIYHANKC